MSGVFALAPFPVLLYDSSGNALASLTTAPSGTEQAIVVRNIPSGTQVISATTLPLPTGAATEATLAGVLTTTAFQARIPANGQAAMAASIPVVIASNQSAVPVSGSVSVTNFPATQPISAASLPLPTGAATETTLGTMLTLSGFQARIPTLGQKVMTGSVPVVIASDQGAISVSGTVTANQGTAASTANAWPAKMTDGTNVAAVKAASTAAVATDPAIVVAISPNNPLSTAPATSATGTTSSVAGSASSVTVLASNGSRKGAAISNDSTAALYLKMGATASTTDYTIKLLKDGYYEVPFGYTGLIAGIWASAAGAARVTEFT